MSTSLGNVNNYMYIQVNVKSNSFKSSKIKQNKNEFIGCHKGNVHLC